MADIKSSANPLFLREDELRRGIELLFYAYRDFTGEADAILAALGLGRAHHRVLYFVGRNPGITVNQLLGILKITKQSLGRVLNALVRQGYVARATGPRDRRQRLLTLTGKGQELEVRLTANQRARIARAFREAGAEAVAGYQRVLLGIVNADERGRIEGTRDP